MKETACRLRDTYYWSERRSAFYKLLMHVSLWQCRPGSARRSLRGLLYRSRTVLPGPLTYTCHVLGLCDINFSISHCDMISISQRHRDIAFRYIVHRFARYRMSISHVGIAKAISKSLYSIDIAHVISRYRKISDIAPSFFLNISQQYQDIAISHNPRHVIHILLAIQ